MTHNVTLKSDDIEVIRCIVREELKKILLGACNVVPVQEHINASTT